MRTITDVELEIQAESRKPDKSQIDQEKIATLTAERETLMAAERERLANLKVPKGWQQ